MHIDIISLVLGAVLWELVIAYVHLVVKPRMKRRNEHKVNIKQCDERQETNVDYKNTTVGFNCKLRT